MTPEAVRKAVRSVIHFDIEPKTIIHVGANSGQEVATYDAAGVRGYHIEAHPGFFAELEDRCARSKLQTAVLACCDAADGRSVTFNVTNNTQSSSLLQLGRHAVAYPGIKISDRIELETVTLDGLVRDGTLPADPDLLLLDVQGAEARVLEGAAELLQAPGLWAVVSEVSLDALYEGGVEFDTLYTRHLKPHGFFLKSVDFNRNGWSDALFLRRWWRVGDETRSPLAQVLEARSPNIGLLGTCSQSSISQWSKGPHEARNAVLGDPDGGFAFHTKIEAGSWWRVDWDAPVEIERVTVFNRGTRSAEVRDRVAGAVLETSLDGETWTELHVATTAFGGVDGAPLRVSAGGRRASALRIRQPREAPLHLDHVWIEGVA